MRKLQVPLPDDLYVQLCAEARRDQVPAATLARQAIDFRLGQQLRKAQHDAIAAYAAEMAGSDFDLDTELECAGNGHLRNTAVEGRLQNSISPQVGGRIE